MNNMIDIDINKYYNNFLDSSEFDYYSEAIRSLSNFPESCGPELCDIIKTHMTRAQYYSFLEKEAEKWANHGLMKEAIHKKKKLCTFSWNTSIYKNNIFSTICHSESKITLTRSAGSIGVRNKRTTDLVHRYLSRIYSVFIKSSTKTQKAAIIFKNALSSWKKKKIIMLVKKLDIDIKQIYNFPTIAHGGTKKRKKRRL